MSLIIYFGTVLFIVCTAPVAIAGGYFLEKLKSDENGLTLLSFFNFLRFLRHSLNFIMLYVLNHKFRKEVRNSFKNKTAKKLNLVKKLTINMTEGQRGEATQIIEKSLRNTV
jgi:hypothetical protein